MLKTCSRSETFSPSAFRIFRLVSRRQSFPASTRSIVSVLADAASGRLYAKLAKSPAVLAYGGRKKASSSRTGPWVIHGYFNTDLVELEGEYLEYARRIAK